MPRRTHPLFLDLAVRKFALPDKPNEIVAELRREQKRNDVLSLEIARLASDAGQNQAYLEELQHQKEQIDQQIEALEYQRSRQAFLEGLAEPPKIEANRTHTSTERERRNTKRQRTFTKRERTIRRAIQKGKKGRDYAAYLDGQGLATYEAWQCDKDNPCPKRHVDAYGDPHWRDLLQKEKSRVKARMRQRSPLKTLLIDENRSV